MKTAIGIAVAAAALLVAAPGAQAKGAESVTLCGISGCTRTHDQAIGVAFEDSRPSGAPSGPAPFMRVLVRFREPVPVGQDPPTNPRTIPVRFVLIPGQKRIRSQEDPDWRRIEDHGGLTEFLERVQPYPASRFPSWLRPTLKQPQGTQSPTRAAATTSVTDAGDEGGFPWLPALLGAAVALALGVTIALRLRRRGGGSAPG